MEGLQVVPAAETVEYNRDTKEGSFENLRGQHVFYRAWFPATGKPIKALVFLFHGMGEHSGRYDYVASVLNRNGYVVFALDHHGHGRSSGLRTYIESFDFFVADTLQFIDLVNKEIFPYPMPRFILGHSLGGAIALKTAFVRPKDFTGVVLSGPAVIKGEDFSDFLLYIAKMLAWLFPFFGVKGFDAHHISRDPKVVEAYVKDPLVYHGKISAKSGYECVKMFEWMEANAEKVSYPFLVLHGTADKITNPKGSQMLYTKAASKDKEIKLYTGLYHEILQEPEKDAVIADAIKWLDARVAQTHSTPVKVKAAL